MTNGNSEVNTRFYVQHAHIDGHAVIDRELGALVAAADEPAAESLSKGLNAATNPEYSVLDRIDAIKQIHPDLKWRAIEHLSVLFCRQREAIDQLAK